MPDTDSDPIRPHNDESAAKQIVDTGRDTGLGETPGGGGLGGASAADALGGSQRAPEGTSPNSPIDIPTPEQEGERSTEEREAQLRSLADGAPEPDRSSR